MSSPPTLRSAPAAQPASAEVEAFSRVALAVAHPDGPELFANLMHELAAGLRVRAVYMAAFPRDLRTTMRTLAVSLDGRSRPNLEFPVDGALAAAMARRAFQSIPGSLLPHLDACGVLAGEPLQAVSALALTDTAGEPLGLLVAMDRRPIARSDVPRTEALLRLVAIRAAAQVERDRKDDTLRAVALAVSASRSDTVFEELVRLLATILHVEVAFIARLEPEQPDGLRMLAMSCDGKVMQDIRYPLAGSPCATVLGQRFRAYAAGVRSQFPDDAEIRELGAEGYAGYPLAGLDGSPIGIISVASRRPLAQMHRIKATLKIFGVRAAAELERLRVSEAQKQALEDLRQREEQYRAIFENSVDGLFLWDEHLRIVDVNPAGLALYGYGRDDIIGQTYPSTMPQAYVQSRLDMVRRALAGTSTHLETRVLRPNGTSFEADLRVIPFGHRDRPHALAVIRDISERRQRERELQDSEAQYRAIFNASVDAMVLRDANFRIVDVNATYEAMSGFTRAEVLHVDRVLANPPEIGERIRALHAEALAGATVHLETILLRRDGHRFELELRGVPITHRGAPHVLYIGRDISDRTAAEQRRVELERQLRQAQKMEAIGQLTGGLAHDFNNILTSVLGYLGMAQERQSAMHDPVLARQLAQARLAADRAREHVAQLLAFSRPRRGERRLLAPCKVLAEVLQLLRPSLPTSITVDCESDARHAAAVPPVLADPVQFEQVLLNLCLNARDAIEEHGTIRLRAGHLAASGHCASCSAPLEGNRWVWFEVADDGRGMSRDVVDRMFEPFFTTKDVGRGTGMGLAMVHGIVHDHGGHVQVVSSPGGGTTFRVLLPASAQDAGPEGVQPDLSCAADTDPPLRGRVLLVEDEPIVSGFMQDLLCGWGLQVVLDRDPVAAARRLAAPHEAFSLLLTDHTMPGMTGLSLARIATRLRPGLPVLLYTGNAADIGAQELADAGVTAVLRKPFDAPALRNLLAELLGSHALAEA
ncbi:MAG: PAS domain S-box protein [Ramlibacter sp.]